MKPEKAFSLLLLACLLLLPLCIGGQTPPRTQADFVSVVQDGAPTWIRWQEVSLVKLVDDNGGPESYWEIHRRGEAEPLIVKDAYQFPEIGVRLKDRH